MIKLTLLAASLLFAHVQSRALKVHAKLETSPQKQQESLLARGNKGPGWFRSEGVRAGVPSEDLGEMGDDGSQQDSSLGYNIWRSDGMDKGFRVLDNLEPTAPMDRVDQARDFESQTPVFVAPYLNPAIAPTISGKGCMCQDATAPNERIACDCGKSSASDHYTWMRASPVDGTNNYTLTPADITYNAGNYWDPKVKGGIAAPEDKLPLENYPNIAPADDVAIIPATAKGERVAVKYARYLDQVHARSVECDTVSARCTTDCIPGDVVEVELDNTKFTATVKKTMGGNTVEVMYVPGAAAGVAHPMTVDCPQIQACTQFRPCLPEGLNALGNTNCVAQHEFKGNGVSGHSVFVNKCPMGTLTCRTITQVVLASLLRKGGKACRAAPP